MFKTVPRCSSVWNCWGLMLVNRWEPLAEYARKRVDDHVLAFTDLHSLMALASADDKETAQAYINALESFANTPGQLCRFADGGCGSADG